MPESTPRVPISKKLVLINSISTVATRVLTLGVFAWAIQYLVKRIPDEEMALLPIAMSFSMALPLIQTVLNAGLARHVTEAYAKNDLRGVTAIVSSQIPWLLIGSIFILIVGGLTSFYIDRIFAVPAGMVWKLQLMMAIITVRLAIGVVLAPFNCGMFATQRFILSNMITVAASLLRVMLMLWLIIGFGPEVHYVVIAQETSQVVALLASTFVSMRLLPALRFDRRLISWDVSKHVLSFGLWYLMVQLSQVIRRASDAPLLFWLSTPAAVNTFFLGSFIDTRVKDLVMTGLHPLLPSLTAMHVRSEKKRLAAAFLRGGRLALWVSLAICVPLGVCSYDFYALYLLSKFEENAGAPTVYVLLVLTIPLTYSSIMLSHIAQAMGQMRTLGLITLSTQLGNLVLTLLFVGGLGMGAVGCALATLVAFGISQPCFYWPFAVKLLNLKWSTLFTEVLIPGCAPAIISGTFGTTLLAMLDGTHLVRLTIGSTVTLVVYLVSLVMVMRPVDRQECIRGWREIRRLGKTV